MRTIKKRTAVGWSMLVVVAVVLARYGLTLFYLSLLAFGSVILFFQQDYHPWREAMSDLGEIRRDAQMVLDSPELSTMVGVTGSSSIEDYADFEKRFKANSAVLINARTYCKILARTKCSCWEPTNGTWVKVHITRGAQRGKDGWICSSDVGLTVVPF